MYVSSLTLTLPTGSRRTKRIVCYRTTRAQSKKLGLLKSLGPRLFFCCDGCVFSVAVLVLDANLRSIFVIVAFVREPVIHREASK
jgi:hypothetical protein